MRKLYSIILIMIQILLLVACSPLKKSQEEALKINFNLKSAEDTATNYITALILKDSNSMYKLLSSKLLQGSFFKENKEINILGSIVSNSTRVGDSGVVELKVVRSSSARPYTSLDSARITVIKEGKGGKDEYLVDDVKFIPEIVCFLSEDRIRYKNNNDIMTNLLLEMDGIPKFSYSKKDKAQMTIEEVPVNRFDKLTLGYSGDKMVFSTAGEYAYFGIVNINTALAKQISQGSNNGGGTGTVARELPIGKDLMELDLLDNYYVQKLTFSNDEKYIAAEVKSKDNKSSINIYSAETGDPVKFKFEEHFNLNEVELTLNYFKEDKLLFQVINKFEPVLKSGVSWQLDFKTFEVSRA